MKYGKTFEEFQELNGISIEDVLSVFEQELSRVQREISKQNKKAEKNGCKVVNF